MEEEDSFETLDELHNSILFLCQEDEVLVGDTSIQDVETVAKVTKNVEGTSDELVKTTTKDACTPGPSVDIKQPSVMKTFSFSPSKLSGVQLPIFENKRLSCLQTPLALAGLSPIVSIATPRLGTPGLKSKSRRRHFSSTPCVAPYQPKRLELNETEQNLITISEIDESFIEQTRCLESVCMTKESIITENKVSNIDILYDKRERLESVNIQDKNYFKDAMSMETPRFSLVNYSKTDETIVEDDDAAELTADILGLEKYIVLDVASQEDDFELDLMVSDDEDTILGNMNSTIIEGPKDLGSTTVFGAESIPIKSSVLLNEETIAVNFSSEANLTTNLKTSTPCLKRKLEDSDQSKVFLEDSASKRLKSSVTSEHTSTEKIKEQTPLKMHACVKKEDGSSPCKVRNVATVTPIVHDVHVPSPTIQKKPLIESEDDSVIEVIMVDESVEVIDISDDSVAVDTTVIEAATDKTSAAVISSNQDAKQSQAPSTKTSQSSSIPASHKDSASLPLTSVTPATSTLSSVNRPQPTVSPNQIPYTLNEDELLKMVKSNWGTAPVHDVNNNLTICSYRKKQAPDVQKSILEGNFRVPPLLRASINKTDLLVKGRGKTPTEIANSIDKQLTNIDNDCHNKILSIEASQNMRIDRLKHIHRGQIQMLHQRQVTEMRNVTIRLQMDPMNNWNQCHKLQVYTDHDNQKISLQYEHNVEMRDLINDFEREKHILYDQAENSKTNLRQIKEKLAAAKNQNPVDPDMVHTTVDLHKGPCRSNGQKQSLVQVCLPADIASYMIREEEMYNMNYKYRK